MTVTNQRDVPTSPLAAVPRGVTVTGLASVHWRTGDGNPLGQIQHAHDDWHANTVRLQVGVPLLRGKANATPSWHGGGPVPALTGYLATPGNGMTGDSKGCHYNADFLGYLDQAVGLARQLGLAVVICAQHEGLDNTAMPEGNDIAFWKIIHDHYGSGVICDLFNEPEPGAVYGNAWLGWQGGGPGSDGVSYCGFEALVSELRGYGLNGTFWVEGVGHASTLQGIAGSAGNFRLSDPLNKIVYSIHHPQGRRTPANWTIQFGYLAGLGIPVVVGEWTNWATKNAECWPDAAQHRAGVPQVCQWARRVRADRVGAAAQGAGRGPERLGTDADPGQLRLRRVGQRAGRLPAHPGPVRGLGRRSRAVPFRGDGRPGDRGRRGRPDHGHLPGRGRAAGGDHGGRAGGTGPRRRWPARSGGRTWSRTATGWPSGAPTGSATFTGLAREPGAGVRLASGVRPAGRPRRRGLAGRAGRAGRRGPAVRRGRPAGRVRRWLAVHRAGRLDAGVPGLPAGPVPPGGR